MIDTPHTADIQDGVTDTTNVTPMLSSVTSTATRGARCLTRSLRSLLRCRYSATAPRWIAPSRIGACSRSNTQRAMTATTRHPPLGDRATRRAMYSGDRAVWNAVMCIPCLANHTPPTPGTPPGSAPGRHHGTVVDSPGAQHLCVERPPVRQVHPNRLVIVAERRDRSHGRTPLRPAHRWHSE